MSNGEFHSEQADKPTKEDLVMLLSNAPAEFVDPAERIAMVAVLDSEEWLREKLSGIFILLYRTFEIPNTPQVEKVLQFQAHALWADLEKEWKKRKAQ